MITAAAEVAHQLATTYDEHVQRKVNEALNAFDTNLKGDREKAVSGYAWGTLATSWKLRARVVGEQLERLGVTA